jgi:sec-independent protein translocase protein TatB
VFGMSLGEIMIIAIIAILFIGPDKLPEAMVKVAKFFRSFKKTIHETKETIEQEIHLTELKEEALSYKKDLDSVVNEYKFDEDLNIMDDISSSIKDVESSVKEIATKSDKPKKKKVKSKKKKKEINKDSSDV